VSRSCHRAGQATGHRGSRGLRDTLRGVTTHVLGEAFSVSVTVSNDSGAVADPDGITFTLMLDQPAPLPPVTVAHKWPNPSGDTVVKRVSLGVFVVVLDATLAPSVGHYRWSWVTTGAAQTVLPADTGYFDIALTTDWPYAHGYCDFADVRGRITGGTWNETAADASVIQVQVAAFIEESTAEIDMALAKRGYSVPLVPQPTMQIGATVWNHLRGICGMLTAGRVELARHGSSEAQEDNVGKALIAIARAQLARIETGEDNLTVFGVAGPSEPSNDPGLGMSEGTLRDLNGNVLPPLFTISGDVPTIGVGIPGAGLASGDGRPW
jgi:hypothetical protein